MKTSTAIIIGLLALSLLAAVFLHAPLYNARARLDGMHQHHLEQAPPSVVFATVALGGLRGLAIDLLWARITQMQDDQMYFEIVQLSRWITQLEPHLDVVWDYHSFNMAYNISILFSDPADRWRWVHSGITMLRDEAIPSNPDSLMLYDRLCRIYLHKFVEEVDPAHYYYRAILAREMQAALNGPAPDYPAIPRRPQLADSLKKGQNLDLDRMRELDRIYGPLDWRLAQAHVVYWASIGKDRAGTEQCLGFDGLICNALGDIFRNGKVTASDPNTGALELGPHVKFLPNVLRTYETALSEHGTPTADEDSELAYGYRKFLTNALILTHELKLDAEADLLFAILRDKLHKPAANVSRAQYVNELITTTPAPDPMETRRHSLLQLHSHHQCHEECDHDVNTH